MTSSQIKELEAIWASNSGDKHPVVTKSVAQGSSEGGRGIKRSVGREPKRLRKPATPAQKHEMLLVNNFSKAKHRGKKSSSQIKKLKAMWASNSGGKRMAHASSRNRPQTKMPSENPQAKRARFATAVASSGGPYAAPSNRVDEVESSSSGVGQSVAAKQLTSHAGRVLHTESSDVAQLAATCQEPRSTLHDVKSTSSGGSLAKRGRSVAQPAAGAKVVPQSNTGLGENRPVKRVSLPMQNSAATVSKPRTILLQLKRPHYDAIKERRKLWEARPLFDGCYRQTIYDKLAVVGNAAILQSGAGTNDRVQIVEVRRYVPRGLSCPLVRMVVELGADLLPDVANTRARVEIYESLYGFHRCARGFVAMRLEWLNEASAPGTAKDGFPHELIDWRNITSSGG